MNNSLVAIDWGSLESQAMPTLGGSSIGGVINAVVQTYLFPIAGIMLLFYLMYGGYQYMISGNDPKLTAQARLNITYAIIGILVIFASYWAVNAFAYILDLQPIKDIF